MSDRLISEDLINAISNLRKFEKNNNDKDYNYHPIISIVRPEWFFSESVRILDDVDIKWDYLQFDILNDMLKDMTKVNPTSFVDIFERTSSVWYQSYHFLPRTKWGIHIRYDSWLRIAKKFYINHPSFFSEHEDFLKFGFLYLFNHALFHYLVENAVSVLEILLNRPHLYFCYYTTIYRPHIFSDTCLEEVLANQYMLKRFNLFKENILKILVNQNEKNEIFVNFPNSNFINNIRILLLQIKDCVLNPISTDPIEQIIDISNPIDIAHHHRIPIWLHKRAKPLH